MGKTTAESLRCEKWTQDMSYKWPVQDTCSGVATPGQLGSGPGQSMAEIIDNIDYEASKSQ